MQFDLSTIIPVQSVGNLPGLYPAVPTSPNPLPPKMGRRGLSERGQRRAQRTRQLLTQPSPPNKGGDGFHFGARGFPGSFGLITHE